MFFFPACSLVDQFETIPKIEVIPQKSLWLFFARKRPTIQVYGRTAFGYVLGRGYWMLFHSEWSRAIMVRSQKLLKKALGHFLLTGQNLEDVLFYCEEMGRMGRLYGCMYESHRKLLASVAVLIKPTGNY